MIDTPPPGPVWLQRLRRAATRLEDGLLILLLGTMIAVAAAQILLRDVWRSGLMWGDPLTKVLVLWVALLGAMAAAREGNHITVDVLSRYLPPRARAASRVLTDLFAAAVCALLAWHGGRLVQIDYQSATLAFAHVPTWVSELIIPAGFGVMALRFLSDALHRLRHGFPTGA
jgi:TRAP-type C4-dicarboxylate transport system permease small subunit